MLIAFTLLIKNAGLVLDSITIASSISIKIRNSNTLYAIKTSTKYQITKNILARGSRL